MKKKEHKRVQVSFTKEQWALIGKFKGEFGEDDAEVVRTIALAWLAEKSMVSDAAKLKTERLRK